jgi:hypothetical protein
MSKLEVDKITPQSGTTLTIGDSGDTIVIDSTSVSGTKLAAPTLVGSASSAGSILFKEDTDNGTNAVTLKGPAATADVTLNLPAANDTIVGRATTDTLTNKTINGSQIINSTLALDKLANGTDGNIISYDANGAIVAVATGNDGQVLTSTGAGSPPAFETLPAGVTLSGTTNNTVATVTGANALVGEANLTFDGTTLGVNGGAIFNESGADVDFRVESDASSHGLYLDGGTGNIGIGLSGPTYRLQLTSVYETSDSPKVFKAFNNSAGSTSSPQYTYWDMAGHGGLDRVRFISYDYSQNSGTRSRFALQTSVDGGSLADRLTIENDGRVKINERLIIGSAAADGKISISSNAGSLSRLISLTDTGNAGAGRDYIEFFNVSGGSAGSIEHNGTSTVAFLTSSDYRLKENVDYEFDATTRLKQLKPARFNFITDADKTVDGFLAHEVSSVVPEAISGTKDETKTKEKVVVNSYGNVIAENIEQEDWEIDKTAADKKYPTDSTWEATKVVPEYQSIDQSKLVPLLVKTIQELEARITVLESK